MLTVWIGAIKSMQDFFEVLFVIWCEILLYDGNHVYNLLYYYKLNVSYQILSVIDTNQLKQLLMHHNL